MNEIEDQPDNLNLVGITIGDKTVNVNPELLRKYKAEASKYLNEEANAKADFKEAVETMSETFGIDKGVLSKWLKAVYKAETKKTSDLAQAFEQLDVAITQPIPDKASA